MGWFRIDDRSADHPKFLALSDGAFRLWVEGGMFCNRHLTDGLILREALRGFRHVTRKRVEELQKIGLWDAVIDGFRMHDYLDWNDSKEVVNAKKQAGRARTAKWRDASRDTSQHASQHAHIASGVGDPPLSSSKDKKEKRDDPRFAEFWAAYPRKEAKGNARKAWAKLHVDDAMLATMLRAIEDQVGSRQWLADGGRFIPQPASWLNAERWTDVPVAVSGLSDTMRYNLASAEEAQRIIEANEAARLARGGDREH